MLWTEAIPTHMEIVTSEADRAVMTVTIEWGILPVCFVE
jgi:hypothetical protein